MSVMCTEEGGPWKLPCRIEMLFMCLVVMSDGFEYPSMLQCHDIISKTHLIGPCHCLVIHQGNDPKYIYKLQKIYFEETRSQTSVPIQLPCGKLDCRVQTLQAANTKLLF